MSNVIVILMMTIAISISIFTSSTKMVISHTGHPHNNSPVESKQKNQINQPINEVETTSPQNNQNHNQTQMPTEMANPTPAQSSPTSEELPKAKSIFSKLLNVRPQPTELVFFLLLVCPYLLYSIKKNINQKESN